MTKKVYTIPKIISHRPIKFETMISSNSMEDEVLDESLVEEMDENFTGDWENVIIPGEEVSLSEEDVIIPGKDVVVPEEDVVIGYEEGAPVQEEAPAASSVIEGTPVSEEGTEGGSNPTSVLKEDNSQGDNGESNNGSAFMTMAASWIGDFISGFKGK